MTRLDSLIALKVADRVFGYNRGVSTFFALLGDVTDLPYSVNENALDR